MAVRRRAYVGLGANLGNPPAQLQAALAALADDSDIELLAQSRFWRSRAIGPQPQPDFCNAVCALDTTLAPMMLLQRMQALEDAAGRIRNERWGPRPLDLDLLHVDGATSDTALLRLPHPEIGARPFVLVPLAEVAPGLEIPGVGNVRTLVERCDRGGLTPWPVWT